ncbi:hypothetical protein HPB51_029481 [Rhipicephalus microplus]|uniref:non-specific serine/threonine protein kinase n=1 Tax=Rhipicephalus microplus TaxID=6941 RepID=A0A9J6CU23_RHIMP|nr:hypothetical protein HPB51_029481 [Rhipicephalus microplus]
MHPDALEFLLRDCTNVSKFFQRQGLPDVLSPKDLFTRVCGLNMPGEEAELLSQIQNYEKNKELLTKKNQRRADLFNTLFEKGKKSRIGNESTAKPFQLIVVVCVLFIPNLASASPHLPSFIRNS